jgi:hypothetical protein
MDLKLFNGWPTKPPTEPAIIVFTPNDEVFEVDISRIAIDGQVIFDRNKACILEVEE